MVVASTVRGPHRQKAGAVKLALEGDGRAEMMMMTQFSSRLRRRADEIDERLGPLSGATADAIAVELRIAASQSDEYKLARERLLALSDECLTKDALLKETLGLLENCSASRGWNIEADRLAGKVRAVLTKAGVSVAPAE